MLKEYVILSHLFQLPFVIEICTNDCNVKINARETTVSRISEVFGLSKEQNWSLVEDSLVEVPPLLSISFYSFVF
jgi:hypothetical protein